MSHFRDTKECHQSAAAAQRLCVSQLNAGRAGVEVSSCSADSSLPHAWAGPEMSSASAGASGSVKECGRLYPCLRGGWVPRPPFQVV
jgi:hypothetical protein